MKVNTLDLRGAALDWAVATCQNLNVEMWHYYRYPGTPKQELAGMGVSVGQRDEFGQVGYSPSTNWADGGPIIDQECIDLRKGNPIYFPKGNEVGEFYEPLWIAGNVRKVHGPTPLIAAMRCYVVSKVGDTVDVPDELVA